MKKAIIGLLVLTGLLYSIWAIAATKETLEKRKMEKFIELGDGDFSVNDNLDVTGNVEATNLTEWISFTPSSDLTGTYSIYGFYRYRGDSLDLQYSLVAGGTLGGPTKFGLPTGFTYDTSKGLYDDLGSPVSGTGTFLDQTAARNIPLFPTFEAGTGKILVNIVNSDTNGAPGVLAISSLGSASIDNTDRLFIKINGLPVTTP